MSHTIEYNVEVITPCLTLNSFSDGVISWQFILPAFIVLGRTKCFLILTFASAPNKRLGSFSVSWFFVHLPQTSLRGGTIALCLFIRNQLIFLALMNNLPFRNEEKKFSNSSMCWQMCFVNAWLKEWLCYVVIEMFAGLHVNEHDSFHKYSKEICQHIWQRYPS